MSVLDIMEEVKSRQREQKVRTIWNAFIEECESDTASGRELLVLFSGMAADDMEKVVRSVAWNPGPWYRNSSRTKDFYRQHAVELVKSAFDKKKEYDTRWPR